MVLVIPIGCRVPQGGPVKSFGTTGYKGLNYINIILYQFTPGHYIPLKFSLYYLYMYTSSTCIPVCTSRNEWNSVYWRMKGYCCVGGPWQLEDQIRPAKQLTSSGKVSLMLPTVGAQDLPCQGYIWPLVIDWHSHISFSRRNALYLLQFCDSLTVLLLLWKKEEVLMLVFQISAWCLVFRPAYSFSYGFYFGSWSLPSVFPN